MFLTDALDRIFGPRGGPGAYTTPLEPVDEVWIPGHGGMLGSLYRPTPYPQSVRVIGLADPRFDPALATESEGIAVTSHVDPAGQTTQRGNAGLGAGAAAILPVAKPILAKVFSSLAGSSGAAPVTTSAIPLDELQTSTEAVDPAIADPIAGTGEASAVDTPFNATLAADSPEAAGVSFGTAVATAAIPFAIAGAAMELRNLIDPAVGENAGQIAADHDLQACLAAGGDPSVCRKQFEDAMGITYYRKVDAASQVGVHEQ